MVSFHCHGCGDVVKKPKLDQHHGRCHAGFDCIDCSVTFHTPSEYKSHTSCISEAEKYQKSLFKGSKNGRENDDGNTNRGEGARGSPRGHSQGRGRGYVRGGRGNFQGRGRHQGGGRSRDQGTGANGTPLGSPQRMSPVTSPVDDTPSISVSQNATTGADAPMRNHDAEPASSPAKNEEDGSGPSSAEQPKKEKTHKDKKSTSKSKKSHKEVEANGLASVPLPLFPDKATSAAEKKKEKKKRKEAESGPTDAAAQPKADVVEQVKGGDSKKRKKKPKGDHSTGDSKTDVDTRGEVKSKKHERKAPACEDSRVAVEEQEKAADSKKRKKKKSKHKDPDTDVPKADLEAQGENKESKEGKRKEKKRKSEKGLEEPIAPPAESTTTPSPNEEDSEKKSRKRKRDGDGAKVGDVTVPNGEHKRTKKGSKDSHNTDTASATVEMESTPAKQPSSGKKRKREEKESAKDVNDVVTLESGKKEKKKRKHKKDAEGAKE